MRESIKVGGFRRVWVTLSANFRQKGASPKYCWCQKTRVILLLCGIKMYAVLYFLPQSSARAVPISQLGTEVRGRTPSKKIDKSTTGYKLPRTTNFGDRRPTSLHVSTTLTRWQHATRSLRSYIAVSLQTTRPV